MNVTVDDEPELTVDGRTTRSRRSAGHSRSARPTPTLPEVTAVETVAVAFDPAATLTLLGLTEIEKSF